jgi:hypothetical protein
MRVTQQKLRGVIEAAGRESCLGEDVMFDIVRNRLGISFRCLGLAVVIQVIGSQTLQSHVWRPDVAPASELSAEGGEVVKPL